MSLLAALLLAASPETAGLVPPAPAVRLYAVAWQKRLVEGDLLEWEPEEVGGPAVDPASGTLVVGTRDGEVRAFRSDGTELWGFRSGAGFAAPPLVRDGVVYAGSLGGMLHALDLGSGAERWRHAAMGERAPGRRHLPGFGDRGGRPRRGLEVAPPARPARGIHHPRLLPAGAGQGAAPGRLLRRLRGR